MYLDENKQKLYHILIKNRELTLILGTTSNNYVCMTRYVLKSLQFKFVNAGIVST